MTPSYRVGLALGNLARHFSGKNSPIKSFEKNYVGLLSRRSSSLRDVKKMAAEIHEKIIMHRDVLYFSPREAQEFTEAVNAIENAGGRYDKTEFAFGFFENYYSFRTKNEEPKSNTENDAASLAEPQLALEGTTV